MEKHPLHGGAEAGSRRQNDGALRCLAWFLFHAETEATAASPGQRRDIPTGEIVCLRLLLLFNFFCEAATVYTSVSVREHRSFSLSLSLSLSLHTHYNAPLESPPESPVKRNKQIFAKKTKHKKNVSSNDLCAFN